MKYLLIVGSLWLSAIAPIQAQSITPAADGTGTVVNQAGNTFNIQGGSFSSDGSNQFHSFQQLGLSAAETANFIQNNPAIQNILGRVTGGDASVINGLIQVTGGNANLYLMNPAGLVFGAGASLNVPASFTATTANGIGFGGGWFSAAGTNNYAALTGTPDRFAFTASQPGAIANAGNLAVGFAQSLTLLGGTVISTGSLAAPAGSVTIATVPGTKLVRLTQTGSLLSLELPLEVATALPTLITPVTLPELITGGGLGNATAISVQDGIVKLTSANVAIAPGDLVAKTIAAKTVTLTATENLLLVESQLQTSGDLNLVAGNTALLRASPANPSVTQAGGRLLIEAPNVDIFTLSNPKSVLAAGGDMVLRSPNPIRGDAFYRVGGNLRFEQSDGNPGGVISPNDPVILAQGDVSLGSFGGGSLHILAGGSVTVGPIEVSAVGTTSNTINKDNILPLNATSKIGSLSTVTRADGNPVTYNGIPILDSAGNVQRITPTQLEINGSTRPTVDIRAGINWSQLGGLPADTNLVTPAGGSVPGFGTFSSPATSANITVASIAITDSSAPGTVFLTNQYKPNLALPGGDITVNGIPVGTGNSITPTANISVAGFDEGTAIIIDSRRSITTGNIFTSQGNVDLTAQTAITTSDIIATTPSSARNTSIVLAASTGNIVVQRLEAGGNGIDIQAGGTFQALSSAQEFLGSNVPPQPTTAVGAELRAFLDSKGVPAATLPTAIFISVQQPFSILARPSNTKTPGSLNAPVTIRTEDGSRGFSQTFPIYPGSTVDPTSPNQTQGLIQIRFGNSGFFGGPKVEPIVANSDPFLNFDNSPVTSAYTNGSLKRNASYTTLTFGSTDFPASASGTVGAITVAAGSDNGFYSAIQDQVFSAIAPGGGGTGGGGTGGGGTGGGGTGGNPTVESSAAQTVQRQLTNSSQSQTCTSVGTRSDEVSDRAQPTSEATLATQTRGCSAVDDEQILKLLDESEAGQPKGLTEPFQHWEQSLTLKQKQAK